MTVALVILAAGKGTRMQSDIPKVLHEVAGASLLAHTLKAGQSLQPSRTIIVAGHDAQEIEVASKAYDENCELILQTEQLGTGHAVEQTRTTLAGFKGSVIILYGDTPLISAKTLKRMNDSLVTSAVSVLGFQATDPGKYGRLITQGDKLDRIVEFKDASDEERSIKLCNSGVMGISAPLLFELLLQLDNKNAVGEYYLTDIVALATAQNATCTVVQCDESETLGVNSRVELAQAEHTFQTIRRAEALKIGITMPAPETVHFSFDTIIGRDTLIEQNVVFGPGVTVENGARIRSFSHLEGAHISGGCIIGPYARLRPGAELAENVKIGNFVEVKASTLHEDVKVNHLSYIGDANIGARTNIGAGTVTCNYDGAMKHQTKIGQDVFIGSNTMLVAPVKIGDGALTASGSVIVNDVPSGALALGRSKQVNKPGLAFKLMKKLKAIKVSKKGN